MASYWLAVVPIVLTMIGCAWYVGRLVGTLTTTLKEIRGDLSDVRKEQRQIWRTLRQREALFLRLSAKEGGASGV